MSFKKDLALIGIGHWGKNLARNFNQLGALHTICDTNIEHTKQYKALYPEIFFTNSYDDVLQDENIRKIVIAAPTSFHYPIAKRALERGKDVFIEKAMSSSLEEAEELSLLADKHKAILMVGHILHYHPCVERIKELVQGGDLGKLLHLNFSRLNFGSRGPENSALWAFAPHDISILLSLCPVQSLQRISCTSDYFNSADYSDQSWLSFDFENETKATIHVSWLSPVPERKLTIVGTKGSLVFDDLKDWGDKLTYWENSVSVDPLGVRFNRGTEDKVLLEAKEPLHEECSHFLTCCLSRKKPVTDGEEGVGVMKVLDLAQESATVKKPLLFEDIYVNKPKEMVCRS